jgi:hypothetical protein
VETVREAGTRNPTLLVVPMTVAIVDAAVVTVGPAPVVTGASVTVMLAGKMVPVGKPEPVTFTDVTPAWAAPGTAVERLTDALDVPAASATEENPATRHDSADKRTDQDFIVFLPETHSGP